MRALDDTIVAPATPPGRGALAIVRISGPETRRMLGRIAPGLPPDLAPRHAYLATFRDPEGEPIDTGLATFFAAPASYTGEDLAELSAHGAPRVVERLLATLSKCGARLARPGEFTERALLAGKMDLIEAEAVRDLIEARTEAAARMSARRLAGALSERLAATREALLSAASSLAATIDFSEDVGEEVDPAVASRLRAAEADLTSLAASYETGRLLSAGCRVAILGRPNAGKSTLFNALVGSPRAIVTEVPGTTRDALEATLDVSGVPVTLVDTAGLRETLDPVERIGVSRARAEAEKADAVLYVLDGDAGETDEDREAMAGLRQRERRVVPVVNKSDRLSPDAPVPEGSTRVCGLSPEAGEKLQALLAQRLLGDASFSAEEVVLGNARQRDCVERARRASTDALESLGRRDSPEYAASHVAAALSALSEVFGETTAQDVLDRIFATFCIGK
jgi:tRNA modification GTPase